MPFNIACVSKVILCRPITGPEEVEAPRFSRNQCMKVVRVSALRNDRLVLISVEAGSTIVRPEGLFQ